MTERRIKVRTKTSYTGLVRLIGEALLEGRKTAAAAVNTALVSTYWTIGKIIIEYEQSGKKRAAYGEELLEKLAKDLTARYGRGFSRSNLTYMRKMYAAFPICETLSHKLSWSHYFEILKAESPMEISFYTKQCEKENWSVRELKRQMNSMLFHRLALSKDKKGVIRLASRGHEIQKPEDIMKDPYVLEFLRIPRQEIMREHDLEERLIRNLQSFLLELGKGFSFIGRQYRISISGRHYYVDLVFYHRILKCFVLIDLKSGEIDHADIGQMNLYLNYFRREENSEGDSEPIGILLGAYKDKIMVEYATANISNKLFVGRYQLYLPKKELLMAELRKLLAEPENADA